jgi:hypothetical protein
MKFCNIHISLIAALCLSFGTLQAQTGKVKLVVYPGHNYQVIVNNEKKVVSREIELPVGKNNIKLWAPTKSIKDVDVMVIADSTITLKITLEASNEFATYEVKNYEVRKKTAWIQGPPIVVSVGLGAYTLAKYISYRKDYKALEESVTLYNDAQITGSIAGIKTDIAAQNEAFSKSKNQFIIGGALFGVSIVGTYFALRYAKGIEVPVFKDKAKIEFDNILASGSLFGTGQEYRNLATIKLRF